jgi:hypothetical protein
MGKGRCSGGLASPRNLRSHAGVWNEDFADLQTPGAGANGKKFLWGYAPLHDVIQTVFLFENADILCKQSYTIPPLGPQYGHFIR